MAEITNKHILTLASDEAYALKCLLGNLNDKQYLEFAETNDNMQLLKEIYSLLPHPDNQ